MPFYQVRRRTAPEMKYLRERREALGGYLPARRRTATPLRGAAARGASTRCCKAPATARSPPPWRSCACSPTLLRDKSIGKHIVPIVPDEARTFGMEGMFRQLGIYSPVGQLYTPEDADQLMYYKEDKDGQILQEGINEAGAMASWIAAATSYATHDVHDDPVLHLLLDVRLPAHRRPRLGGGRHARARLPARRHRRPHHAQRRGPAAPGRPQHICSPRRSRTASPTTRPSPTSSR